MPKRPPGSALSGRKEKGLSSHSQGDKAHALGKSARTTRGGHGRKKEGGEGFPGRRAPGPGPRDAQTQPVAPYRSPNSKGTPNTLYLDCTNANEIITSVRSFVRCHHREKLSKENVGCLRLISDGCARIYDNLKIKSLIKEKRMQLLEVDWGWVPCSSATSCLVNIQRAGHLWLLPPGTEHTGGIWMLGTKVQKLTATYVWNIRLFR